MLTNTRAVGRQRREAHRFLIAIILNRKQFFARGEANLVRKENYRKLQHLRFLRTRNNREPITGNSIVPLGLARRLDLVALVNARQLYQCSNIWYLNMLMLTELSGKEN